MRELGLRTMNSKMICGVEPLQPLFALGSKKKWYGTVPFPLEMLFIGHQIEQHVFLRQYME